MKNKATLAGDWLRFARQYLESLPGKQAAHLPEDASLETQVLLSHALEKPRAWILAHPETILTPQQLSRLTRDLASLAKGMPLPYLIGHWEFYGIDFEVTPAVLIPRPETELLVDRALDWLRRHPDRRAAADVGVGSGCITVSLAKHSPDLHVLGTDRSFAALQVARRNAERQQVSSRVHLLQMNLLDSASGPFDLVCANLPYIPHETLADLPVARHEPLLALDGGEDGLDAIQQLITDAPRWLSRGGMLLLEMQYDQGSAVAALAQAHFPDARTSVINDLAGLPRLVEIERTD